MTDTNLAGWFADPFGRYEHRYWDGAIWTAHVSTQGTPTTDPLGIEPSPPGAAPVPTGPPPIAPTAPVRPWSNRVKALLLGGGAGLAIGAFLPWVKAHAGVFTATKDGIEGDGVLTLILAVAIVLFVALAPARKGIVITVLSFSAIAMLIAIADVADVSNRADDLAGSSSGVTASVGVGLWLTAVGAALAIAGAVVALVEARQAPSTPA